MVIERLLRSLIALPSRLHTLGGVGRTVEAQPRFDITNARQIGEHGASLSGQRHHAEHGVPVDGVGFDVGANLLAALPNKSGEDLLVAVFDPNREVDPRYVSYNVVTTDDRVLNGVVAAETPTSITLRRADGNEDTILRSNISSLRSTGLSLMPEGLEKQVNRQDLADLFELLSAELLGRLRRCRGLRRLLPRRLRPKIRDLLLVFGRQGGPRLFGGR